MEMDNNMEEHTGYEGVLQPTLVTNYLRDAAEKYYKDIQENNDIAGHSMIRLLATLDQKEELYEIMKEAGFSEEDIEMVHRKAKAMMPL
eukprot:6490862-Amphidinium_carterae.4